ncbi:MAG: ABC transporter substrate-binding protein [Deltaproteobacteria bacterium]|nr:ABC transporter substrate-binding protein [Deltaproteobacteria bacterium]
MLALLLACTAEPQPAPEAAQPPPRAVQVALNWYPEPEFGGYYAALKSGAYRKAGLDVTIVPGGPGVPVLEMLAASKIDVAISGADDLLLRRAKGLDAVAIFAGLQDSPVGLLVHVPGPNSFAEVAGPVAIEAGSPFQQTLWAKMGWEGKVQMVPTTGSLGAFAADPTLAQQAYITSEPCQAEDKDIETRFLAARDIGWNPYAALAVVRGADAKDPWMHAFVTATMQGWHDYLADPGPANVEIAKLNPEMTPARLACIVKAQAPFVKGTDGVGVVTQARMNELAVTLTGLGLEAKAEGSVHNQAGVPTAAAP